jgi:hypothetical protein
MRMAQRTARVPYAVDAGLSSHIAKEAIKIVRSDRAG